MTLVPHSVEQLRTNFEAPPGRLAGVEPVLISVATKLVTRAQTLGSPCAPSKDQICGDLETERKDQKGELSASGAG